MWSEKQQVYLVMGEPDMVVTRQERARLEPVLRPLRL